MDHLVMILSYCFPTYLVSSVRQRSKNTPLIKVKK